MHDTISYVDHVPDWACRLFHVVMKGTVCRRLDHDRGVYGASAICGACGQVFDTELARRVGCRVDSKRRLRKRARR